MFRNSNHNACRACCHGPKRMTSKFQICLMEEVSQHHRQTLPKMSPCSRINVLPSCTRQLNRGESRQPPSQIKRKLPIAPRQHLTVVSALQFWPSNLAAEEAVGDRVETLTIEGGNLSVLLCDKLNHQGMKTPS